MQRIVIGEVAASFLDNSARFCLRLLELVHQRWSLPLVREMLLAMKLEVALPLRELLLLSMPGLLLRFQEALEQGQLPLDREHLRLELGVLLRHGGHGRGISNPGAIFQPPLQDHLLFQ